VMFTLENNDRHLLFLPTNESLYNLDKTSTITHRLRR